MATLQILIDEKIIDQLPVKSVSEAKLLSKELSEDNDQKTFVFSTVNPAKMIENTMIIKRPNYG